MKGLGRLLRVIFLVNGTITLLALLTATEGCHARLPFALPLSRPSDFVANSQGHVFVHSDFHRAITAYDAQGRFVRNIAVPGGPGRGLLAVDEADRLYVNKADLLVIYDAGGRLVEFHAVPPGGDRSWRLLPDGTVTSEAGPVDDALAWRLRPRRPAARGEVLFVDWGRKRRPLGIWSNALLDDAFTGKDGSHYAYLGFLAGIERIPPAAPAPPHPSTPAIVSPRSPAPPLPSPPAGSWFRPARLVELFTYPYSLLAWVIVPGLWLRARRKRARRRAAAAREAVAVPAGSSTAEARG